MIRPGPVITEDNEGFWLAAREGRLVIQRCASCGRLRHPPRPMCPDCHSLDWDWMTASGRGVVYSYSFLHHPRHPAFSYPIVAILVDLEEGTRLLSNLVGVEPDRVRIGLHVEVDFEPADHDLNVPVFRPRSPVS